MLAPMLDLMEMTYPELVETFRCRYGKGHVLAAELYREFFKRLNRDAWQATRLSDSKGLADRLAADMRTDPGEVVDEIRQDGVIKFVTRLGDNHRIESVVLPMETHETVCVSSQVGCRMGCDFCETARMGLVRQLSVTEIVGQVFAARQRRKRPIRNVVFMGMGEPFDNFENVIQAIRVLSDQRGLDIAQRYITVSTAGRIDGIARLAALKMAHLKLAVSLNAPNDRLRERLMPVARAAPLAALQTALRDYPLKKGVDWMVAYVVMAGLNDGPAHARQLADWLAPLRAKVNLIPYNPGRNRRYRTPDPERMETFRRLLLDRGVNVQQRSTRGRDLMAACGQLGSRSDQTPPAHCGSSSA
jgi:23S rRNA (adenine2503-C2)-methyltransferase